MSPNEIVIVTSLLNGECVDSNIGRAIDTGRKVIVVSQRTFIITDWPIEAEDTFLCNAGEDETGGIRRLFEKLEIKYPNGQEANEYGSPHRPATVAQAVSFLEKHGALDAWSL